MRTYIKKSYEGDQSRSKETTKSTQLGAREAEGQQNRDTHPLWTLPNAPCPIISPMRMVSKGISKLRPGVRASLTGPGGSTGASLAALPTLPPFFDDAFFPAVPGGGPTSGVLWNTCTNCVRPKGRGGSVLSSDAGPPSSEGVEEGGASGPAANGGGGALRGGPGGDPHAATGVCPCCNSFACFALTKRGMGGGGGPANLSNGRP